MLQDYSHLYSSVYNIFFAELCSVLNLKLVLIQVQNLIDYTNLVEYSIAESKKQKYIMLTTR